MFQAYIYRNKTDFGANAHNSTAIIKTSDIIVKHSTVFTSLSIRYRISHPRKCLAAPV